MQKTIDVRPDEVANPDEVAQMFDIVFIALARMKEDSDAGSEDLRRSTAIHLADLKKAINTATSESDISIGALRKIIGSLEAWRSSESTRTTDADISEALAIGDENAAAIKGLEKAVKELKQKSAVEEERTDGAGRIPDHEWEGTRIRFENTDGSWGEWIDLRGPPGEGGGFSMFGTGMGGVRKIKAGSGITVSGDPGEPTISAAGAGASTTLKTEQLVGTQSGNDVLLAFSGLSQIPTSILFVARQGQVQVPASSAPADGSSAVNITGLTSARVYNADAASEVFLVGYGY